jgi:RNA polymerase sigma-70 factor (TIGR02960 family)
MLPIDHGPPADPHDPPGPPLVESTWIEPYPDEQLGLVDGRAAPEARYERREGVELAFVAALQHLPPNQRAALILREVAGLLGQEIAEALETTVAAVNSALQRARRTVDQRLPERTQQATLRALGDQRLSEVVESYMDAMGRGDVDAVVSLLAADAVWSMPPLGDWYRGADEIAVFLVTAPLNGNWHWRHLPAHASGQAAVGSYICDAKDGTYRAFALDVLTLRGDRIADITSFINRTTQLRAGDDFLQWPHYPRTRRGPPRTSRPSGYRRGWTEWCWRCACGAACCSSEGMVRKGSTDESGAGPPSRRSTGERGPCGADPSAQAPTARLANLRGSRPTRRRPSRGRVPTAPGTRAPWSRRPRRSGGGRSSRASRRRARERPARCAGARAGAGARRRARAGRRRA